jgi:cell shape-determining protein MreC
MLLKICLIVAILGAGAVVAVNFVMVKPAIETTIKQRDEEAAAKKVAVDKGAATQKTLDSTSKTLAATKNTLTTTQNDLATAKQNAQDLQTKNTTLADQLKSSQATSANYERDLALQAALARLGQLSLTNKEEDVQLPAGLKGHVAAVDPKFGFVILDIGEDKGVLANGIMMVARGGNLIGKVQISRVDKTQSIANILPAWRRGEVMEGDVVLYQ